MDIYSISYIEMLYCEKGFSKPEQGGTQNQKLDFFFHMISHYQEMISKLDKNSYYRK